jgi:hypothetical protein
MPSTIPAAGEAMPTETKAAKNRLAYLVEEAATIIRDNPALMIDHVNINAHGVYTSYAVPGFEVHAWEKARRLLKELSAHLEKCDKGKWTAYVMPPIPQNWTGFAAFPMGHKPDHLPVDRVERLSWELSEALKDYQGGSFQAMVLPANVGGHTVMLTKIVAFDRGAKA